MESAHSCGRELFPGNEFREQRGLGRTKLLKSMGVKEGRGSSKARGQILFPCSSWEITSELLGRIISSGSEKIEQKVGCVLFEKMRREGPG